MGQAALFGDGNAAQPRSRGGSRLRQDEATATESAKDRLHNRSAQGNIGQTRSVSSGTLYRRPICFGRTAKRARYIAIPVPAHTVDSIRGDHSGLMTANMPKMTAASEHGRDIACRSYVGLTSLHYGPRQMSDARLSKRRRGPSRKRTHSDSSAPILGCRVESGRIACPVSSYVGEQPDGR